MGWFNEQIRERQEQDQKAFTESVERIANAVLGDRNAEALEDASRGAKDAMEEILHYYKLKPRPVPDTVKDFDEQLEYCMRPYGIMRRPVTLREKWYRDGYGPLIVRMKGTGIPVAVLPYGFGGYYRIDPETGDKIRITKRNASELEYQAYVFYRPLPQRSLKMMDIINYMRKCFSMADLAVLIGISLTVGLVGLLTPRINMLLTGLIYESRRDDMLLGTAAFILAASVTGCMINISKNLMLNRMQGKVDISLEAAAMMRVLSLPAGFFRQSSSGEMNNRLSAVSQLGNQIMGKMLAVILSSLTSLLYIAQIANITPSLALPALAIVTGSTLLSTVTMLRQMQYSRRLMNAEAKLDGMTYSVINGVQKIKLAGAEKRMFARWGRMYAQSAKIQYDPALLIKVGSAFNLMVTVAGNLLLYFVAVESGITVSRYIAFSSAFGSVSAAFRALADIAMTASSIKPTLEMAEPILKAEPETSEGREILTGVNGTIELDNVSFRYDSNMPYVIDKLSLKIKAGEYVAVVGRTGCGKSTLVRLLLGFEKPEKGAIYYDGKDLNTLDLRSLRRRIGSVTQDGKLVQGEIFENIVISAPQLTLKDAWEAAEIAGIAQDIREMPMGMNTVISDGEGGISGGQKQRIMIARAIAPKPRILIFDEATSALDNLTQRKVSQALDGLHCTRIVIAHRLSTIRHCDRILLLEDGNIAESGTYDELIQAGGKFAELVERQRLE